jgi:spatacsin
VCVCFSFQLETKITKSMESAITKILEMIPTVTLRYRLASLLGIKRIISDLINCDSLYYMKDTDYGRKNEEL